MQDDVYFLARTRVIRLEPRTNTIHIFDEFFSDSTHVTPNDLVVWVANSSEVDSFTITFKHESPLGWPSRSTPPGGGDGTREVHGRVLASRPHGRTAVHYPYAVSMVPKGGNPENPLVVDPDLVIDPMD